MVQIPVDNPSLRHSLARLALSGSQSRLLATTDRQCVAFYLLIAYKFRASRRAVHCVCSPAEGLLLFAPRPSDLIAVAPETGHLFPLVQGMAPLPARDERTGDFSILRMRQTSQANK
jgi:hypothetical protein